MEMYNEINFMPAKVTFVTYESGNVLAFEPFNLKNTEAKLPQTVIRLTDLDKVH